MRKSTSAYLTVAVVSALACSGKQDSTDTSTGGNDGAGATTSSTGGSGNAGGSAAGSGELGGSSPSLGGQAGTGGPSALGGQNASGGSPSSGGSSAGGGTPAAGGNVPVGGAPGTGGLATSGGGPGNTGGTPSNTGGGDSTGGSTTGGSEEVTCPSTTLQPGDSEKTIQVGSDSRSYILHVPSSYDGNEPVPLVLDFHGITGNGSGERQSSPYVSQTSSEGVIMAFPTGKSGPMGNAWNVGPCCVADVDDVAFAKAMVEETKKVACIDPKRVYAVGFSMGGGMSHYLACRAADVFAAVAPAAFDLLEENVGGCKPSRPISVISFRGTNDNVVSYDGGYSSVVSGMPITFLGAENTAAKWAELNGCTGSASAEDSNGCAKYSGCSEGVEVVLCTKQGGAHEAGNASVGWPFLEAHPMP